MINNQNKTNQINNHLDENFHFKPYIINRLNLGLFPNISLTNEGKTILLRDTHSFCQNTNTEDRIINLVTSLAITSNTTFFSSNNNETIKLWNINSGECINTLRGHTSSVNSIVLTPDKKTLISGSSDKTIKLWDIKSGKCIKTLSGHTNWINELAVTPDGNSILSIMDKDKTIKLWDIKSGKCIKAFFGHTDWINELAITPDGNKLISRDSDLIKIWDIKSGKCIKTLKNSVSSLAITPDGKTIITGGSMYNEDIELFDIRSGECIQSLKGHTHQINTVAVTPDGKTIISGSLDKKIKIWDLKTGKCLKTLEGHTSSLYSLVITPDGKTIISGSFDETIKLWDISNGKCIYTIYNMEDGSSITMLKDGYFRADKENIDKYMRIEDGSTNCRKLTKEEIKYFCKMKYINNSLDNDYISNIQPNSIDVKPSQKSKIQIVTENLGAFFVLWGVIILLNQFFLFQGCFNPDCILAALPHTGVIALILLPLLLKDQKIPPKEYSYESTKSLDMEQYHNNNQNYSLKEIGDSYEKEIGKLFESKRDFVIYNGLIKGFDDGGVDLIVISPNTQSINFIQCKNWQKKKMDYHHIKSVYDKLTDYSSNINIAGMLSIYIFKYSSALQEHLYYKKERNEIASIFKSSYNYTNIIKTLYISTDQVIAPDLRQQLTITEPNTFHYKDMKIVINKI